MTFFGCSHDTVGDDEPSPTNYGTMSARISSPCCPYLSDLYEREFIPNVPVSISDDKSMFTLQGSERESGYYITINVPITITSQGTFTYEDGIRASLSNSGGYIGYSHSANEAKIIFTQINDKKVIGTFSFSSDDSPYVFEVTDGKFNLVRE
jgi:hypothetical protein